MFRLSLFLLPFVLCGCQPANAPATFESEPHGHSHERDKMMLADVGKKYHAALTAHLSSKDGNELDIFFETADEAHKPVPLPLAKFNAQAVYGAGKEYVLEFEPAPLDERKGDPDGKCSHFVAKAGWMKPEDQLTIIAIVDIDGKLVTLEWNDFNPKKFAHHID